MDMLKKIAIKEIIEENRELRDCNDTYKYIVEKALNINDRLIAEVAELEEEIELLKREKEELRKVNIILSNDNAFLDGRYQKLINGIEELKNKYSGGF